MKLIIIYGPPAVGKLTVATELSAITGYKVFHNHLALDFIETALPRSSDRFWKLLDKYRLELINEAAKSGVEGLIMTSVHINGKDDIFIKKLVHCVEKNTGTVNFVRLSCDRRKLAKRLKEPSRKKYGKLTDQRTFNRFVKENDVFSKMGFTDSYNIDNTAISARKTAKMIKEHYGL